MAHETSNDYEPPTLDKVGSLHDITKAGGKPNSDGNGIPDNAFSNPA